MKQLVRNSFYYLVIPIILVVTIVLLFNMRFSDLEKAVGATGTLVQSLAIIIGGLWAYQKFDWNKRAESAIKLKAMLMEYEQMHSQSAAQYRIDQHDKKDLMECWTNHAMRMIPARNNFASQIHLSAYIPKKTRQRLFDIAFLSLNKGREPQNESIDENWKKLGEESEKVQEELDDLVSK